jgi:hypothetical protein
VDQNGEDGMTDNEFHGSMTMSDGSRRDLTAEEAKSLWEQMERAQAKRAAEMPDTHATLSALVSAGSRMRELGWHDSRYCPHDDTIFAVCEIGSTGIWTAHFAGAYIHYGDSVTSPGSHMFWKAIDKLDEAEKATLAECDKSEAEYVDRIARAFGAEF